MLPRRHPAQWRPSSVVGASISPQPARSSVRNHHGRVSNCLLLLLCVCMALVRAVDAESDVSASHTSHFNGLRVISGSSFRAFSNRFRRQLRSKAGDCLTFHEADNWWRYEWCVGRHVRQFHVYPTDDAASPPPPPWSIMLGRFASDKSKTMRILPRDDLETLRNPDVLGYLATQQYTNGDVCETVDKKPRSVEIQYKCCVFRVNETYIEAVEEAQDSPCTYTLSVCTPVACGLMHKDQYVFGASTHVSEEERLVLVDTVKEMFYHAYNGYMDHAFPLDALLPLSCKGERFELGKIPMLTLIDTLDTLAILQDAAEFQRAVALVVQHSSFDLDTEVSVFETTIRVLGGLLSAHLFAVDASLGLFASGQYHNELLTLAIDLGDRLMPSFNTTTGIPYGTVNLRRGVPRGETPIASTAGAGSLSMEFTMLSVLTGNASYATASRRAVRALYERRSQVGLLGKHIDTKTGEWTETVSGPGSNSDSFYEYLWKMYATFNDGEMLEMFDDVYAGVSSCNVHGDWFADVSMWSGCAHSQSVVFENLVAFWPGMQASLGHLNPAARSMNAFYRVWREYGFVPEQFNVLKWKPVRGGSGARYPLRPELIESTFYMHEATNDSTWLRAGAHFVHSLQKHTKTKCGYATVRDIERKELEDNMPSFFLSETCKYLYLLFNTTHFLRNGSYVFTTEAHPFPVLPAKQVERVLLPTVVGAGPTRATSSSRQCAKPVFWHALGYQLDYEGLVVEQTERCSKPMSAKNAGVVALPVETKTEDWLPLMEKKLREQLEQMKQHSGRGGDDGVIDLGHVSEPTDEVMKRLSGKVVSMVDAEDLDAMDDYRPGESRRHYLQGGARLGLFQMDEDEGVMRVTRQDTGEWVEITGLEDSRFAVLSWLPERRGFRGQREATAGDADDELPLLLPLFKVYDFSHGRKQPAQRRLCSLEVTVGSQTDSDKEGGNPYASASSPSPAKMFSLWCTSSTFGVLPSEPGTQRSQAAPIVFAEPLDGCVPFMNPEKYHHKIVVVKRGACFFETKARNAAAVGALGLVVVNNEEEDRVMVMSGSGETLETEEFVEDKGQSVAVSTVMIPRRAGEWLHRQLLKSGGRVLGRLELSMHERESDVALIHDYMQATAERSDSWEERILTETMMHQVYPRMERGRMDTVAHWRVFAPEWGVDMQPVRDPHTREITSWMLQIVATEQTLEDARRASP